MGLDALMNKWEAAIQFTLAMEGGYDNNPDDTGGETFRGISRHNWPEWPGWELIDFAKESHPADFQKILMENEVLLSSVKDFYKINFWYPIHGDELPGKFAVAAFDFSVNSGVRPAIRTLQSVFGVVADGYVGPKTIQAAYAANESLVITYLARRAKFLHGIMDSTPSQETWALNWFRRLFKLANVVLSGDGIELN